MKTLFVILCSTVALGSEPKVIPLWPGVAPGSENWTEKETDTGPNDPMRRVSNVSQPTLTVFLPAPDKANGTGIVVCPGGGFRVLAIDREGNDVARWLNSLGVTAFVLKYRVMQTGDAAEKTDLAERRKKAREFSVTDGQQAMRIVRARAGEFGLTPQRIGIMGFSAGGYVTAMVALHHDGETRPDFSAPIYPLAPEDLTVPADAGPLFIVQADDDKSLPTVSNSVRIYAAWNEAKKSAELHIYSSGGHGFSMRKLGKPVDTWTDRFRDWLDVQGLLKK